MAPPGNIDELSTAELRALVVKLFEVVTDLERTVAAQREEIARLKGLKDPFGVDDIVERHDRVVSIPGKGANPAEPWPHLGLEPLIQHMVQKNVREAGRDYASLRGAHCRSAQETVFDGPCSQPFIDHPSDDAIRDSLVEESAKLTVRDRIEVFLYVDVDNPVETLCPQFAPQ